MTQATWHIGFDDTDSIRKGCTTYIAALLVEKLAQLGAEFIDYPNLIRLNPNVPWKTRGNGALCLRIRSDSSREAPIKEAILQTIERESDLASEGTEPGVVFLKKETVPFLVRRFAFQAITGIVELKQALDLIKRFRCEAYGFKDGRGIIGALAAVGETLTGDHTYEVIAYRSPFNFGSKRLVDEGSIVAMDRLTAPLTFNNYDEEKKRVIITPRGPDPILFGIRGESPEIVKKAFRLVKSLEPVDRWMIFRTNQGTDMHFRRVKKLSHVTAYGSVIARGLVSTDPKTVPTRHVIFGVKDETKELECAAYEPTGNLRHVARELQTGDGVEIYGAVRAPSACHGLTINLEKIRLLKLVPKYVILNPLCPDCGKRLKSLGREQGFRCEKCRRRFNVHKMKIAKKRNLSKGLYVTSSRSQRHLTKPLRRYGLEKNGFSGAVLIPEWHVP